MDGTNNTSDGLGTVTRPGLSMTWRWVSFVIGVGLSAFLIAWMDVNISHRIRELEREFGDIKAERYNLGVHMGVQIRHLNEAVLGYHRQRDVAELARFRELDEKLQDWLDAKESEVQSPEGRRVFAEFRQAYGDYLANSAPLTHPDSIRMENEAFDAIYERVQQLSKRCLELSLQLIRLQRQEFNQFMLQSQRTLDSLQRLAFLSSLLLLGLSTILIVVVYRGMIAPLRVQLHESQDIIHRQEKLASLGVLAAGVAHEIRNPLTAIKFRLFSLKRSMPPGLAESEDTSVIGSELNRLERIVRDFLQFARPSEPTLLRVPALRLLQEVQALLGAELDKSGIQLKVATNGAETDEVWVRADTHQLKQVLINLVQNAAESTGRKGIITLRATDERASLLGVTQPVACLEVADNGKGIPPEVEQRLFDPFFTTKEGGTGLGLPIAARIVEKHGGELRYHTELNRGTTFRVILPRAAKDETEDLVNRR